MHQTIVLADDHFLATEGIKAILSRVGNIEIVGEAANGILAITLIRKLKPDCAVIDLAMPGASGLEVLFETKRWTPQTRVIIVTGNHSPKQFAELKDAGADGIILKNSDPDKIREAILSVLAGRKVFPQEVREIIARSGEDRGLSRRELEVLIGIGKGKSNQAIGETLGISPKTVDTHRTNLMRKFAVNSAAALVLTAMREGYLDE